MRGKLYIAYGSNLNLEQMQYRCPTAKFVGTGILENYELQFKGSLHNAHATIAPKPGAAVPVGIWEIQSADELRLDYYEGYPSYYFKQELDIPMGDKTIRGWPISWISGWDLEIRLSIITTRFFRAIWTAAWM